MQTRKLLVGMLAVAAGAVATTSSSPALAVQYITNCTVTRISSQPPVAPGGVNVLGISCTSATYYAYDIVSACSAVVGADGLKAFLSLAQTAFLSGRFLDFTLSGNCNSISQMTIHS